MYAIGVRMVRTTGKDNSVFLIYFQELLVKREKARENDGVCPLTEFI